MALPAGPALAQAEKGTPPERVRSLLVYGDDPCPRSSGEEIVVCARLPESERFRVPRRLRDQRKQDPESTAWGSRVRALEYVTRHGRPNSCSPVGSLGQSGCTQQLLSQWRAERDAAKAEEESIP